jgi:hypothetical protein
MAPKLAKRRRPRRWGVGGSQTALDRPNEAGGYSYCPTLRPSDDVKYSRNELNGTFKTLGTQHLRLANETLA